MKEVSKRGPARVPAPPPGPKPGYDEWLTRERLNKERAAWAASPHVQAQADWVRKQCEATGAKTVLEFGCAVGYVPAELPDEIEYVGVDANPHCIMDAHEANPRRQFVIADIRNAVVREADIVVAFAFLKHFHLDEWNAIIGILLAYAQRTILTSVTIAPVDQEDRKTPFPHVWVTEDRLRLVCDLEGFCEPEFFELRGTEIVRSEVVRAGHEHWVKVERRP